MNSTLLAAVVAAFVSGLGWLISQLFAVSRESVGREINARIKFIERQLEEFYGPLFSLTCQIEDARAVRDRMIRASALVIKRGIQWDKQNWEWIVSEADRQNWPFSNEELDRIKDSDISEVREREPLITIRFYTLEQFIYPLYEEASKILAEKMHLLGRESIPDSYRSFMRHALQNRLQNRLYKDKKIPSRFTSASPYPREFSLDVGQGLQGLMIEYYQLQGQVADAAQWRAVLGSRLRAAFGLKTNSTLAVGHKVQLS